MSSQFLEAARKLACPAVILTANLDGEDFAMVSTAAYASINPLMLSTTLSRSSRTAKAILESKRALASVLSEKHLAQTAHLASAKSGSTTAKLEDSGFKTGRETGGIIYVCDALAIFELLIEQVVELDNHFLTVSRVPSVLLADERETDSHRPLIRYNRRWTTVESLSDLKIADPEYRDNYPV